MQKKMYKVLTPIQKKDNSGSWFMRVGSGYTNKDDSINLYLDAVPCGLDGGKMKLQIRELDAEDLRQREANRASYSRGGSTLGGGSYGGGLDTPSSTGAAAGALGASESVPF